MRVIVKKSDEIPELHHSSHREYHIGEFKFLFFPLNIDHPQIKRRFPTTVMCEGPLGTCIAPTDNGKVYWGNQALRNTTQDVRDYVEAIVNKDWHEFLHRFGFKVE